MTEKRTTPTAIENSLSQTIKWYKYSKFCLKLNGSCLKGKNASYTPPNRINVFIIYELDSWLRDLDSDFTLRSCLFGGVKLATNAIPDKHAYSDYGTEFDTHIKYSLPDGSVGKNVIISGADMSSSVNIDNKGKGVLIFGKSIK